MSDYYRINYLIFIKPRHLIYSKVQKHLNTIGFDTSPPLARFCGVLTQMRSAFLTSPIP